MNHISQYVADIGGGDLLDPLPLIHTTSLYAFRGILENGLTLETTRCPEFDEDLLYFFYGKPGYFPKTKTFSALSAEYPVFLVIDSDSIGNARRVLPFDSGGFKHEAFQNYFSAKMPIEDFVISPSNSGAIEIPFPETAARTVQAFYESNTHYYFNKPRKDINYDSLSFEVESYFNIISSKEHSDFDERCSLIEIQKSGSLSLTPDNLLAVLVPSLVADSGIFTATFGGFGKTEMMFYSSFRSQPSYFASLAVEKVGEYLARRKLINVQQVN